MRQQQQRAAAILAAVLVFLTAGKCDPGQSRSSTGGHDFPVPAGQPVQAPTPGRQHNVPNPGAPTEVQGPPVVRGDAGPENDSHFVVYQVVFITKRETGGHVDYTDQNGRTIEGVTVKSDGRVQAGAARKYSGAWEHVERARPGIAMGMTFWPLDGDTWSMCSVIFNGHVVDYLVSESGPCAVSWQLPQQLPPAVNP